MVKQMAWMVLAVLAAAPVMAQDEAAPAAEEAPAEAAAEAAPAEEASAPVEETAATEDSSGDSGDGSGLNLYVGIDYDMTTVDIDNSEGQAALSGSRFDSDFYKLRLGMRLFEAVGLEFHAGFPANNAGGDELETKQFFAAYLVPTGVLFELIEVSARIGYAYTELGSDLGSEDADGASFGLGVELPLRHFGEGLPNLRIGAGGTVYQQDREGRIYGFHGGLRYDFSL